MLGAVSAVTALMREPTVASVALVGPDRSVLKVGFSAYDETLAELGSCSRQLFREAAPPLLHLDLHLTGNRLLLLPVNEHVLMLVVEPSALLEPLLGAVERQRRRLVEAIASPVSRAPVVPPRDERGVVLDGLEECLAVMRGAMRGPVLRHYMRQARAHWEPRFPFLAGLDVNLGGFLVVRQAPSEDTHELLRGVAWWLAHALDRAHRLHEGLDVAQLRLALRHLDRLAALGFWEELINHEGRDHAGQP